MIFSMYSSYKSKDSNQSTDFDLFIVEKFYEKGKEKMNLSSEFWTEAWNDVSINQKRPIEWFLSTEEFEKLDSVYIGFKNISNEKFYYVTWGQPNSRIRQDLLIYRNGKIDSIPFGGFGCGTGIYITPLINKETAGSKLLNPLMINPYTGYDLPLKNKKFPDLFKEIYGDSVSIKFKQATYSLPWNKFPSQIIESSEIVISTRKVIENWKKRDFKFNLKSEKEYESSYTIKDNDVYKTSSLFESKALK